MIALRRYLSCGLLGLLFSPAGTWAVELGKPVPKFSVATLDGSTVRFTGASDEVVVLNLWATWCGYCREEMPALETYFRRHNNQGLRLIAVSMDDADADATVRKIMRGYSYPAGLGRLSDLSAFGRIWRLPMTFVIDRHGILRRDGGEGDPKVDLAVLEREVTPLLKEAPSPAEK